MSFLINPFAFVASFSPSDLSPALWLDASDTSTITESGGSVSQWDNKGSLGNFTQATGAVQPTTGSTTLNGRNVIDFAGDYLTAVNQNEWKFLHDTTKYVAVGVFKAGITSDPDARYFFFGNTQRSSLSIGVEVFYDDRASLGRNNQIRNTVRGASLNVAIQNISDDLFPPNAFGILQILNDPNNGTAADRSENYLNNGAADKNNSESDSPSNSNPTYPLQIGADGNDTVPLTGSIAEVIIVSGTNATETNRVALRNYLNTKWGVY